MYICVYSFEKSLSDDRGLKDCGDCLIMVHLWLPSLPPLTCFLHLARKLFPTPSPLCPQHIFFLGSDKWTIYISTILVSISSKVLVLSEFNERFLFTLSCHF